MWLMCVAVTLGALKTLAHLCVLAWPWVHAMSWWWVLGVSAATVLWWWWADTYGYTQRKAQARMERRQAHLREQRAQRLRK